MESRQSYTCKDRKGMVEEFFLPPASRRAWRSSHRQGRSDRVPWPWSSGTAGVPRARWLLSVILFGLLQKSHYCFVFEQTLT